MRNETELVTKTENFVSQIMHIDCMNQSNKLELSINPTIPYDTVTKLKEIYNDMYLAEKESNSPIYESEMTTCLKHDQPINCRACQLAYIDKAK